MKFLIWGTGNMAEHGHRLLSLMNVENEVEIIGYIDNDSKKWGKFFNGKFIFSPSQIEAVKYDAITIWVMGERRKSIERQLIEELEISNDKIIDVFEYLKKTIYAKYEICNDLEIQKFLDKLKLDQWIGVYYYEPQNPDNELKEVYYDEDAKLNYILFEQKRMYLKGSYSNFIIKG